MSTFPKIIEESKSGFLRLYILSVFYEFMKCFLQGSPNRIFSKKNITWCFQIIFVFYVPDFVRNVCVFKRDFVNNL